MKQKLLFLLIACLGLTSSVKGQMDTWMLNQWLNQINMDVYQQQQKLFDEYMKLLDAESKRRDANATAVCILLPGGADIFFARIQTLYLDLNNVEVVHQFPDMREKIIPSSSYLALNGTIITNSVFKPGHTVLVRRKDTGKILSETTIPSKNTMAYQKFLHGAQQAAQAYGNSNQNFKFPMTSPGSTKTRTKVCSLCRGQGWIAGSKTPVYGTSGSYWCEECGREVYASHSHDRCPSCGGSGSTY